MVAIFNNSLSKMNRWTLNILWFGKCGFDFSETTVEFMHSGLEHKLTVNPFRQSVQTTIDPGG